MGGLKMFGPEYYTENQLLYTGVDYLCHSCRTENDLIQANPDECFFIGPDLEFDWDNIPVCSECGEKSDCCRIIYPDGEQVLVQELAEELGKKPSELTDSERTCSQCGEVMDGDDMYRIPEAEIDDSEIFHQGCIEDYCNDNC